MKIQIEFLQGFRAYGRFGQRAWASKWRFNGYSLVIHW